MKNAWIKALNLYASITLKILVTFFIILDLFVIASYFLAARLGLFLFFGNPEGISYAQHYSTLYVLVFMLPVQLPVALNVGGLFAALMVVYTACLVASSILDSNIQETMKKMVKISPMHLFDNWLLAMPTVSSMLLYAVVLLQSFQEAGGIPTGGIAFSSGFEALAELAYSPLLEEIGFRITPIGIFLAVEALVVWRIRRRTDHPADLSGMLILSFFAPNKARRLAGLKTIEHDGLLRGIGLPGWVVILMTSGAFGLAHFVSGSGWEIGKISSAFVAGLGLSLIFWRYGAHAATLVHWFFNYYSYVYQFASENYVQNLLNLSYALDIVTFWLAVLGWLATLLFSVLKIQIRRQRENLMSA